MPTERPRGVDSEQLTRRLVEIGDDAVRVHRQQGIGHARHHRFEPVAETGLVVSSRLESAGLLFHGVDHGVEGRSEHRDLVITGDVRPFGGVAPLNPRRDLSEPSERGRDAVSRKSGQSQRQHRATQGDEEKRAIELVSGRHQGGLRGREHHGQW